MKIAIIGFGKMGKTIESLAKERGHEVVLKISSSNKEDFSPQNLQAVDVAIEFSTPEAGYSNVKKCIENGVRTVSGTTGWIDKLPVINDLTTQNKTGFIYASNFSLGVNLFFALNENLAQLMHNHPKYKATVEEIHHTSKKDSPSGTGITIAEQIIEHTHYKKWVNSPSDTDQTLPIISKRIDPAPGTHTVSYTSEIDTISINHTAHSRKGFALGAVIAAEWLHHKEGVFTMRDVLNL